MGNHFASKGQHGPFPDYDRRAYFSEDKVHMRVMQGSNLVELVCVPHSVGCEVRSWDNADPDDSLTRYKVKTHLSHSEFVPRYQMHVIHGGTIKPWIVGHMEKVETHLRCKTGEFVRAQVWTLTSNSMVLERTARSDTPDIYRPSSADMIMMSMTIVLQAKRYPFPQQNNEPARYNPETERWIQKIAVDDPNYRIEVGKPGKLYKSLKNMPVLSIYQKLGDNKKEKLVCCARQQRFAGALGNVEQPFLGVQIKLPPKEHDPHEYNAKEHGELAGTLHAALDTRGVILLLICLAWSERTMTNMTDMSSTFITAMRKEPGEVGSAEDLGLSVQWDTHDVTQRLKHVPHAAFHMWDEVGPREDLAGAKEYPRLGMWPAVSRQGDAAV